jgi:hypothetical protein
MARYWVGDSGNWGDTAHWSDQSNGAGGFSVPISTDNVFFDAASFNSTSVVTVNVAANCLDLDWSGLDQLVTFTSSVYSINIYGSTIFPATKLSISFSSTAYWYFRATSSKSITTNGMVISGCQRWYMDGVGGKWTLQDHMTCGNINPLTFVNGEFDTNNKNITQSGGDVSWSTSTGTKTVTLGSSIISLGNGVLFGGNDTSLTLNSGTSTIKITGDWFSGGGKTYNNIELNSSRSMGGYVSALTCNNLSITPSATVYGSIPLNSNITVNNTLTIAGGSASPYRVLVYSNALGTQRIITANTVVASNVDFRDIKFSVLFDLSAITGGSGDAGGNTNIIFTAAQPQYFKHTSGAVLWSNSAKWFTDVAPRTTAGRVPLPQDNVIFDAASFTGSSTLTIDCQRIGSLDMSGVTQSVYLIFSYTTECYGDYILGNNIGITTWKSHLFYGRNTHYINLFGKTVGTFSVTYTGVNGKYINQSDFAISGDHLWISGYFDFNDFNASLFSIQIVSYGGTNVYLGNGTITLNRGSASTPFFAGALSNVYSEGSTIKFIPASSANFSFDGGGKIYNKLWFSGANTGYYTVTGANTIMDLVIDAGIKVKFTAGTNTKIKDLTAIGTALSPISISGTTASTYTLTKTQPLNEKIEAEYLTIYNSIATPSDTFYAGVNSINGGGNTGWIFSNFTSRKIIVQPNKLIKVDATGRIVW